jgi:hypothetical protein
MLLKKRLYHHLQVNPTQRQETLLSITELLKIAQKYMISYLVLFPRRKTGKNFLMDLTSETVGTFYGLGLKSR